MPKLSQNNNGLEINPNLFLAPTKPFISNKNFLDDFYLKKFNLLDFGHKDKDFSDIYDSDSRIEQYINAEIPSEIALPDGFVMAGHGNVSRDLCGEFLGARSTKQDPSGTLDVMRNSCSKLGCPTCVLEASTVKSTNILQKIRDYIWFLVTQGVNHKFLVPKHYTLNPNYIDKSGNYHENFVPDLSTMKNYHQSIKDFEKKHIDPFLDAYVLVYHHHRFANEGKTILKVSPHFHVIGFGKFPKYEVFLQKFGFIYTNEGYLNTPADIFRVARYELTHGIFPQKNIKRKSVLSEKEFAYKKKEKSFETWLTGVEFDEVTRNVVKESKHSFHSYFYGGNLSPYNIRYLKCKVKKRTPKGLKKIRISLPMRDLETNHKIYEIIAGLLFRMLDKLGRWKYYTLSERIVLAPRINKDIQVRFDYNRLKFGKLYKTNSYLNWIKIKKFNIKNFEN